MFDEKEEKNENAEKGEERGGKEFLRSPAGQAGLIIFLYALIFGVFMLLITVINTFLAFLFAAVFGYFGWKSLDKIQPDIFLIMPIAGWVIYFLVKGFIAVIIGMFVTPFVIARKIAKNM